MSKYIKVTLYNTISALSKHENKKAMFIFSFSITDVRENDGMFMRHAESEPALFYCVVASCVMRHAISSAVIFFVHAGRQFVLGL